jgi:hypothetical protein
VKKFVLVLATFLATPALADTVTIGWWDNSIGGSVATLSATSGPITPIDTDHVRGVQGRYFVVALPAAAVFIAALVNRELPRGMSAAIAIAGSMIAGITTVEAVLRPHW